MKKIVYITAKAPFGRLGETYILPEMLTLKELGVDLLIIPRDRSHELFHKRVKPLLDDTLSIPLFNIQILMKSLKYICKRPISFFKIVNDIVFNARNLQIALKNLIILPKALYLSMTIKRESLSHIHAHYGSTTSTMAYIISKVINVPWSFTVHRWDITENNLLKDKCKTASFARTIDEQGRKEMIEIVKDESLFVKISVIHVGVDMREINKGFDRVSDIFTLLCPAMFVPKKGHKYLFEACRLLSYKGIKFKCLLAGEGPLKDELKTMVSKFNLNDCIEFLGALSHERILDLYSSGRINAVVLTSIVTENGDKEGIPVSLMEAMSYGIPVISTNTGGIPELISNGNGVMIDEKDPEAISVSIEKLINDTLYCSLISERGNRKIENDFNISVISKELLKLFIKYSCN